MKKVEMVSQFRPPTRQPKKQRTRELPRVFDQQTRVESIHWNFDGSPGWYRPTVSHPYTRLPVIHPGMNRRLLG
jgi:hypothetical protein